MMAAESVFDAVSAITFGPAQTFRNLTLIPVIADDPVHADYLTLDEALGVKALRIEETSDAGTVPELRVLNDGDVAVLLLDGEELVGAKQNRVLNLSILVPPGSSITIPVSCVEHGRWSRRSARFASSPRAALLGRPCSAHAAGDELAADIQLAAIGPGRGVVGHRHEDVAARLEVGDVGDGGDV